MKVFVIIFLLSLSFTGYAQEMDLYKGLMYKGEDMQHLKEISDSLNHYYKECNANPVYHSLSQTQAKHFNLKVNKQQVALLESRLNQNISLQQMLAEVKDIKVEDSTDEIVAYKVKYNDYEKKYIPLLYAGNANGFYPKELTKPLKSGNWVYITDEADNGYCDMELWRLDKPFTSIQLPQEYAKMIQYVDCMIDSNTTVMLKGAKYTEEDNVSYKKLRKYVYQKKIKIDDADEYIYTHFHKDASIHLLLNSAVKEAIEKGNGNDDLEGLAGGLISKDSILLMKRSRKVVGYCSMDNSPREHARNIAVLASQTHQWPVFIRAHLDIMNDYFLRNSDGSYAEQGRKTYLRELELLDIPTEQLLLGSIFRASNLSDAHYFGDVNRIGRAFTESEHAATFEKMVKAMMKDENLDPFNQCLFFMLYTSYCYRQPVESVTDAKINELKTEVASYPAYIREGINGLRSGK